MKKWWKKGYKFWNLEILSIVVAENSFSKTKLNKKGKMIIAVYKIKGEDKNVEEHKFFDCLLGT